MTLDVIYRLLDFIANKEIAGGSYTPDNISLGLLDVSWEIYNEEFEKVMKMARIQGISAEQYSVLFSNTILQPFIKSVPLTVLQGVAAKPSDFENHLAISAIHGGAVRNVEIVSNVEANARRASVTSKLREKPICIMLPGSVMFYPTNLGSVNDDSVELDYLRKPTAPFYDYVIDSVTGKGIYLTPGMSVEVAGIEAELFDVYADEHASAAGEDPVYHLVYYGQPSVANAAYRARTVELEWAERVHIMFVIRLLSRVGINLQEAEVFQYAELMKKEGK